MNIKILIIFQLITFVRTGSIARMENKDQAPEIEIPQLGRIKGKIEKSYFTHRRIYHFLGINYAKSPSGNRRFQVSGIVK